MIPVEVTREKLLLGIHALCGEHGFIIRKSECQCVRKTPALSHIFWLNVQAWTDWISVVPGIYIGNPEIIRFFNLILGRKLKSGNVVCGYDIRNKYSDRGFYKIETDSDIAGAIENLRNDFVDIAIPVYGNFSDLNSIDNYLNARDETGRYLTNTADRACMGLIAAKLCHNPNYDQFFSAYYNFLKSAHGEEFARPILQVRDYFLGDWNG